MVLVLLENRFPWLVDRPVPVSGADTIDKLSQFTTRFSNNPLLVKRTTASDGN
jgi:hypothetical protein